MRVVSPSNQEVAVLTVAVGESVMHAAVQADVRGIEAECGGCLSCATCHVYVRADGAMNLAPVSAEESELLEFVAAERRPESRLSCQLLGSDDLTQLTIELPDRQVI